MESSGAGRREPGAGIVSTNPAMPLALLAAALAQAGAHWATGLQEGELCYGTDLLQGEMTAKGPGASALQHQSADTRCPPGSAVGWSEN